MSIGYISCFPLMNIIFLLKPLQRKPFTIIILKIKVRSREDKNKIDSKQLLNDFLNISLSFYDTFSTIFFSTKYQF